MNFGLKLGLKNSDIETVIKKSLKTPDDCLQHVFVLWLKQPSQKRTWKNLVQALIWVGEIVIANKIKESYCLHESGMIIVFMIMYSHFIVHSFYLSYYQLLLHISSNKTDRDMQIFC